MRLTGLLLALLPLACWAWTLRDPCGLQGEAWRECWAHHQVPHAGDEPAPVGAHHHTKMGTLNLATKPVAVGQQPWKRDGWLKDDQCWCFDHWSNTWEFTDYKIGARWAEWMLPADALPLPVVKVES